MTRQDGKVVQGTGTESGGPGLDSIQSTSWSVVRTAADQSDPERARRALLDLVERYRAPVRAFIEQCGYSEQESDSLTLRFLEKLGQPGALGTAAASGGRFRTWLLEAIGQFLSEIDSESGEDRRS